MIINTIWYLRQPANIDQETSLQNAAIHRDMYQFANIGRLTARDWDRYVSFNSNRYIAKEANWNNKLIIIERPFGSRSMSHRINILHARHTVERWFACNKSSRDIKSVFDLLIGSLFGVSYIERWKNGRTISFKYEIKNELKPYIPKMF